MWRHNRDGTVAVASPPKETQRFGGREYVLEEALPADFGLVRAARGDRHGNLVFHASARTFNPLCITDIGPVLRELAPGVSVDDVVSRTGTALRIDLMTAEL